MFTWSWLSLFSDRVRWLRPVIDDRCVDRQPVFSMYVFYYLFQLMVDARIPDISSDPEKAMLKLQEKFRLDLNDEEAMQWMQKLINDSASALMPQVMETAHRWATYWR